MSERKRSNIVSNTIYVCLILLVAYVFNVGPVFGIFVSGKNDQRAYQNFLMFYAPIVWADQNTPLNRVIGPYLMFWERVVQ